MKTIEAKIKAKLSDAIEKAMDDEELLNEFEMTWPDDFAGRMADAALSVLLGMQDVNRHMEEQGMLK